MPEPAAQVPLAPPNQQVPKLTEVFPAEAKEALAGPSAAAMAAVLAVEPSGILDIQAAELAECAL